MEELMTFADMQQRFDSEWILVSDPEVDEHFHVVRGTVVCHSKDRDEVYRRIVELRLNSSATLYTGKMPDNTAMCREHTVQCGAGAHLGSRADRGANRPCLPQLRPRYRRDCHAD